MEKRPLYASWGETRNKVYDAIVVNGGVMLIETDGRKEHYTNQILDNGRDQLAL
jgi:hypothetical protein